MTRKRVPEASASISQPRWDGRRMLFEVLDADHAFPCSISMNALQDLGGKRRFGRADMVGCFIAAREQIDRIALRKLHARAAGMTGLPHIWSDDIHEPRPVAAPMAPPTPTRI